MSFDQLQEEKFMQRVTYAESIMSLDEFSSVKELAVLEVRSADGARIRSVLLDRGDLTELVQAGQALLQDWDLGENPEWWVDRSDAEEGEDDVE